jgi:hypothetical protein
VSVNNRTQSHVVGIMTHHAPDYPVGLHLNRLNVQSRLPGRYYLLPPIKAKHLAQIVICNCLRVLRLREFDRTGICHFLRCYNDMSSFTIILRGVSFALEEENLRFDSPNYFTSYFLGEFEEGAEGKRLLTLNRHPEIFRIYLNTSLAMKYFHSQTELYMACRRWPCWRISDVMLSSLALTVSWD